MNTGALEKNQAPRDGLNNITEESMNLGNLLNPQTWTPETRQAVATIVMAVATVAVAALKGEKLILSDLGKDKTIDV